MILPQSSTFNPTALYTLWYVNGSQGNLQLDHFIGPMIGAIIAGCIAAQYFPDDSSSWIRKTAIIWLKMDL